MCESDDVLCSALLLLQWQLLRMIDYSKIKTPARNLHPFGNEFRRTRGVKSCNAGSRAWATFRRLGRLFDPSIQCLRAAKRAWWEAKEAAAVGDAAAVVRLPALREKYQVASILSGTLIYHTLHGNEPPPRDGDSDDDGEE